MNFKLQLKFLSKKGPNVGMWDGAILHHPKIQYLSTDMVHLGHYSYKRNDRIILHLQTLDFSQNPLVTMRLLWPLQYLSSRPYINR